MWDTGFTNTPPFYVNPLFKNSAVSYFNDNTCDWIVKRKLCAHPVFQQTQFVIDIQFDDNWEDVYTPSFFNIKEM